VILVGAGKSWRLSRLHDVGGALPCALVSQIAVIGELRPHAGPIFDLPFVPPWILVQGDGEAFDELRISGLDEPGNVFGVVLVGLGDVVSEPPHDLVAD